jgi:hypothetical protein
MFNNLWQQITKYKEPGHEKFMEKLTVEISQKFPATE